MRMMTVVLAVMVMTPASGRAQAPAPFAQQAETQRQIDRVRQAETAAQQAKRAEAEQRAEQAKPGSAPAPAPQGPPPQLVNIRIDVMMTESGGTTPSTKTVSVTAADAGRASVRSTPFGGGGASGGVINVDARPRIERDGRVRALIIIEYRNRLSMQFDGLLESGKKLLVSQAPDPTSDASVTAEVLATVLK